MRIAEEPLVSVVTPFYNTEKYLAECIESVLGQTYGNWEYILLNNCSTDKSFEIARSYADRDPRIQLVSNETFLGQVQNYNQALRQISPESRYCKVVQADDWIFPECIAEMVAVSEARPTVGVVGSYWLRGNDVLGGGLPYPTTFMVGADVCRWQLLHHPDKHILTQPTAHLIRSDLVRDQNQFYDENIKDCEDYIVWFNVLKNCDFGFVHKVLTYQRVDNESFSARIKDYFPHLLSSYICVNIFGKFFLSNKEFTSRHEEITERYYEALSKLILYNKNSNKILNYHYEVLTSCNCSIDSSKKIYFIVKEFLDSLRHPKQLARMIRKAIS